MSQEILRGADKEDSDVGVVAVDKVTALQIAGWPDRASPGTGWISNKRGPASGTLKTGDILNVSIWDSADNSLLVPAGSKQISLPGLVVSATGAIFLPYVGDVVIGGETLDAARSTIENKVRDVAPSAQILVTSSSGVQNSVDLVSGMVKPGTYPLVSRNQTILSMLATGGGIGSGMRNPIVRLIRDGSTYEISARKLLENGSLDTVLRGGDKILVEQDDRYFTALGASGTERLIYFEKDQITALEAMSIAGGLLDGRADPKGVLILRNYAPKAVRSDMTGPPKSKVVFTFDLTKAEALFAAREFNVFPGDTVLVSESSLPATQSILSIFGSSIGIGNAISSN
jgi:polysaccharide biosynthesis/export protein